MFECEFDLNLFTITCPGVLRNLILQFQNDTIDESPALAEALRANSLVAPRLTYRTLPGDHTRPLLQTVSCC